MADRKGRYARAALTAGIVTVGLATWVAPRFNAGDLRPSDFDAEMRTLETEIAHLRAGAAARPEDVEPAAMLAYGLYRRAALAARAEDFAATQAELDRARQRAGSVPAFSLLQATLDLRQHRLGAARTSSMAPALAGNPDAALLAADIDLQQGQYEAARRGYEAVLERAPTWAARARLAFLAEKRGDEGSADRLYEEAADDLTAKEMRAYAWLALQRGQLQFRRGQYGKAQSLYRTAAQAYSGYWLVEEYTAELMGATRRFDDAVELYQRAIARAPRPDLLQQLGDLYVFMGRPAEARRWHAQALEGYLASYRRGEVEYLHHLAGYYADVAPDGAEAVRYAREDFALRPHYATEDALAWALYKSGDVQKAAAIADRALSTKVVDAHLYYHAAIITSAAGRPEEGRALNAALADLNPRYGDFHVHR